MMIDTAALNARAALVPALAAALALGPGCARSPRLAAAAPTPPAARGPDYARPLTRGAAPLRKIEDPADWPDLAGAYRQRDELLLSGIDASLRWFQAPSSRRAFPMQGITHAQAAASLLAFRDLLQHATDAEAFTAAVTRRFDLYQSVGYDGRGVVLFTGYFAPVLPASRVRTARFTAPLYRRPADLVTDPRTGEPRGRRTADGGLAPYFTRRQIEGSGILAGGELVWLEDPLSAYLVHVNGSAKLRLRDGSVMYVGYAGKTDRPYSSLGQAMVDAGLLDRAEVSLPAIRAAYARAPARVEALMAGNENYVFFGAYDRGNWPAGSLGFPVAAETSLATDKKIFPRGGLVLVDTESVTFSTGRRPFTRFMLDQDTGGAIQAPGRADIFMGVGPAAEILAGRQHAEGRMYYLFLKPRFIGRFAPRFIPGSATARRRGGGPRRGVAWRGPSR